MGPQYSKIKYMYDRTLKIIQNFFLAFSCTITMDLLLAVYLLAAYKKFWREIATIT